MRKALILGAVLAFGSQSAHAADTMRQYQDKVNMCQAMLILVGPHVDEKLHELHMKSMAVSPDGYITSDVMYAAEYQINKYMYTFQHKYYTQSQAEPEVCRQQVESYVDWIDNTVSSIENLR